MSEKTFPMTIRTMLESCTSSTDIMYSSAMTVERMKMKRTVNVTKNRRTEVCTSTTALKPGSCLPPCAVCGQKATGYHYGANTCEACKGFFRRSLKRLDVLNCKHKAEHSVVPGRRHSCASCRYKRCVASGMSLDAIKTGRYTLEKRTKDTMELKKLELQDRLKCDGGLVHSTHERSLELERVIDRLSRVHFNTAPSSTELFAAVCEAEAKFIEHRALEEQIFGQRKGVPRKEYNEIYEQTGIDIDGRRAMLTAMAPNLDRKCQSFLVFAKSLPGFNELQPADQLALMKASGLERCTLLFGTWCINVDRQLMSDPHCPGVILDYDTIEKFHGNNNSQTRLFWNVMSRYQSIDLTEEEAVLAAAVCLMNADAQLSRVSRVITTASVDYLLEALVHLINQNHDPEEHTLAKLFMVITDLRSLRERYEEFYTNIINDAAGIQLPELFIKIYQ